MPMRAAMRFPALPGLVVALALSAAAPAQAGEFACRETPIVHSNAVVAPLAKAVAAGQKLTILSIGSSSTEGVGASAKDKTYPSRLQALLGKAWPKSPVEIVNAGIGGETAPQTLARLGALLSQRSYDLVIWQVGTNDAVRGGDIEAFKAMVRSGIKLVRDAGPSLMILDQQYYPAIKDPARYASYVAAVGETARDAHVPVFARYDAMSEWYRRDADAFRTALWTDGFHMSDAGYDCLARDMALSLVTIAAPSRPVMAASR